MLCIIFYKVIEVWHPYDERWQNCEFFKTTCMRQFYILKKWNLGQYYVFVFDMVIEQRNICWHADTLCSRCASGATIKIESQNIFFYIWSPLWKANIGKYWFCPWYYFRRWTNWAQTYFGSNAHFLWTGVSHRSS